MQFMKELLALESKDANPKKRKNKKDKSADRYDTYISGNMFFKNVCSGPLAGTFKNK